MEDCIDIKIKARIPFLPGKTVMLVEDAQEVGWQGELLLEDIGERFRRVGYGFIYLPQLLEEISPEVAAYLFPGYQIPGAGVLYRYIADAVGIGNRWGFLYKKGWSVYFRDLSSYGGGLEEATESLAASLCEMAPPVTHRVAQRKMVLNMDLQAFAMHLEEEPRFSVTGKVEEVELEPEAQGVVEEIRELMRKYNLTPEKLALCIKYTVKLSHLRITRHGEILLTDFVDSASGKPREVKMDTLTKVVYFLYLKHPEGIRIQELDEYEDEMMHLYMRITCRDDKDEIRGSIRKVTEPFGNRVNVSMSRIKAAFKSQVGEMVARFYWIEGRSGEPYRVELDRDYVIWEY